MAEESGSAADTVPLLWRFLDSRALAEFPFRTRMFVRGSQPNTLYAIAPILGEVVRVDATTGEILASLAHPSADNDTACLALADHGQALLGGDFDGPLLVLDPIDLRLKREIQLPSGCWAVVPLDEDGKVLVLSGDEDSQGQFPTASVVDFRTGDSRQVSVPRPTRSMWTEYGYGNPWVRVDDLIIAPGRQGILVADARSGEVLEFIEGTPSTEGSNYCCEIAWDPFRRQLLIVGDYHVDGRLTGKLVSYRIERERAR